ncbi:hypothetical protein FEM08_07880 [Flavobacterium gilvum]|nr:hypothetical protein FEM08_07880 [Flavobacterium gilvum]
MEVEIPDLENKAFLPQFSKSGIETDSGRNRLISTKISAPKNQLISLLNLLELLKGFVCNP